MENKIAQRLFLLGAAAVLLLGALLGSWDSGAAAITQNTALSYCNSDSAPSIIYGDGPQIKMWWSTDSGIYYSVFNSAGQNGPVKVLEKSSAGWDSGRISNPSVIKGNFYTNGQAYTYAMYYTGTSDAAGGKNHIGVAFSNDGTNWNKYTANPIINAEERESNRYGVGIPSACISSHGEITIIYFDSATNQNYMAVSTDGIHFTNKTPLQNHFDDEYSGDIAYSPTEGKWYITTQSSTTADVYIYESADSNLAGIWEQKSTIPQPAPEKSKNQNPKWMRYPNGNIYIENNSTYKYIYHKSPPDIARSAYATGWEFAVNGDHQGWNAVNITKDTGPVEGFWTFITSKDDPYLTSPAISVPATSYSTVSVRIANQNANSEGKIYFKTTDEDFYSEDKSVPFTCTAGGGWYTHRICMAANDKWTGTITGIRVDPVSCGTIAACGVDFIRLAK